MRSKKVTPYDAEEQRLQTQSASIMDFLKRKGVVEDVKIDDETVRKAQKTKAQKAYHKIAMVEDHKFYAIDRYSKPIARMQKAIYVLSEFVETIDPRSHQIADSPSQIRFSQGKTFYEIIVLNRDDEHLTHLLHPENNKIFLIVVPDMDFAETLWLPEAQCIFVTLEQSAREFPIVNFYSA